MTVLDAHALVAALSGEPARSEVEGLMVGEEAPRMSTVNVAESVDVLVRLKGRSAAEVDDRLDTLVTWDALVIVPLDDATARRAGMIRADHYTKQSAISLADCVAASLAESLSAALVTSDPHLARVARDLGVEVLGLPDSSGQRP